MKKFLMGAAAVLLALGGLLTGCTNGDDDDGEVDVGPTVTSLEVSPKTVTLTNGSALSSSGIIVTAYLSSGASAPLTKDDVSTKATFTIDGTPYEWDESLKVGTGNKELTANNPYKVTVSYKEKSAQFTLTLTNWSVEGANTIKLVAGDTLKADWATGIKVKDGAEDVTGSATIALYGDGRKIEVGETITGTKFEIRVTYNGVIATIEVEVTGSGEEYKNTSTEKTDENKLTYYALETTAAESLQGKDNAIDIAVHGGANGTVEKLADAELLWENPLAGKTDISGVTISFDLYANTEGTYSGVLGFYDKTTAGFLWVTDTQWFLNVTANTGGDNSFIDKVPIGAKNAEWQIITIVADSNSITTYNNGVAVGTPLTALNGEITDTDALVSFLTNSNVAYIIAGNGVSFWNNPCIENSAVANIRVYPTALTEAQVQKVYKETFKPTAKTLTISGQPTTFQAGNALTLGNAATVTVTDNYNSVFSIDAREVTLSAKIKDGTTTVSAGGVLSIGTYTVTATYTATESDVFTGNATATYDITVTSAISSIKAGTAESFKNTYDLYIQNVPLLDLTGLTVTATYNDNTSSVIKAGDYQITTPTKQGENTLTITYGGKTDTVIVTVKKFISVTKCGYTGTKSFGAYNVDFTDAVGVPVNSAVQTVFNIISVGEQNYTTPNYLIKSKDGTFELLYFRTDNWANVGTADMDSDWNWGNFHDDVNGSTEYVTVVNNGATIDIYLHFVKNGVVTHHQYYTGGIGNNDAVQFLLSGEQTTVEFCE